MGGFALQHNFRQQALPLPQHQHLAYAQKTMPLAPIGFGFGFAQRQKRQQQSVMVAGAGKKAAAKKPKAAAKKRAAPKKAKSRSGERKTNSKSGSKGDALQAALKQGVANLGEIIDVWVGSAGRWFSEKDGDALMELINAHEAPWVEAYLAIPGRVAALKKLSKPTAAAHAELHNLAAAAQNVDSAMNELNDYTADLQEGVQKPSFAAAKKQWTNFFNSLIKTATKRK